MAIATVVARPVGAGNSRLTGVQNRRHTFGEACTRQGLPGRSHHAGARSCRGACIANASSGKGGDLTALVVGGGGREHALCDAIAASESAKRVICAPGNPGIEAVAECKHGVDATDKAALKHLCQEEGVDVAVVGPEEPLVKGVADGMREAGVAVVGPSSEAAELEGSKAYLKSVLQRAGVPTAEHRVHETVDGAESDVLARIQKGVVIKADGLAAGKGVFLPQCESEARESVRQAFELGNRVLVEDRLHGKEASFFALVSGDESIPLGSVQDHKRAFDNEEGPNTGGMGALSPTSALMPDQEEKVMERVVLPTARQLVREGRPFKGILFAGLMMSPDGSPYVLEHNIRLGDPEAQVKVVLLTTITFFGARSEAGLPVFPGAAAEVARGLSGGSEKGGGRRFGTRGSVFVGAMRFGGCHLRWWVSWQVPERGSDSRPP